MFAMRSVRDKPAWRPIWNGSDSMRTRRATLVSSAKPSRNQFWLSLGSLNC